MISSLTRRFIVLGAVIVSVLLACVPAPPASAAASGAIAQGFKSSSDKGKIVGGALVSFRDGSQTVELATNTTAEHLVGVADQNSLLSISSEDSKQTQVVIGGTTNVLVSDVNGPVHAGDKITASPIAGVGMVATADTRIVGVVQSDLKPGNGQRRTITDNDHKQHQVYVGYVPLQVSLANYQSPGSSFLPPFVQNLANSIAGKQVSVLRILFCSVLLLVSFLSLAIFISSSARSAMVSIGRNPLASSDIRKSLYQVGMITIAAWGGALLASYFILTL